MRRYEIKEIFDALQGEGYWSGTPATFVRFAACNLWSGREETRVRDAERCGARCPLWCDTDFVGGEQMTATEIAARVSDLPLVVFTGGEPLLQLDVELALAFHRARPLARRAVETNGTVAIPTDVRGLGLWVCVSPKTAPDRVVVRHGDELKLVFPAHDPAEYEQLAAGFGHRFLQPQAGQTGPDRLTMEATARYCVEHPSWRLSVQLQKVVGFR